MRKRLLHKIKKDGIIFFMERQVICEILSALEGYIRDVPSPNYEIPIYQEENPGIQNYCEPSDNLPIQVETWGFGVENPIVAVINLTPCDSDENLDLLNKMLAAIKLYPGKNVFVINHTIISEQLGVLISLLKSLSPKGILFFGENDVLKMLGHSRRQMKGEFFEFRNFPSMITFAPRDLNACVSLKKLAWQDLKVFKKHLLEISAEYREFAQ